MDKKIFLPNAEQASKMIENAWQEFRKQAEQAGFLPVSMVFISKRCMESFAKDAFAAGYAYGHNDCLGVIRGQLEAMDIATGMYGENKQTGL